MLSVYYEKNSITYIVNAYQIKREEKAQFFFITLFIPEIK